MTLETTNTKTCNLRGIALVDDLRFVSECSYISRSLLLMHLGLIYSYIRICIVIYMDVLYDQCETHVYKASMCVFVL